VVPISIIPKTNSKNLQTAVIGIILIASFFGTVMPIQKAYSSTTLSPVQTLSTDGLSFVPQVAVDGLNVYVVWVDGLGNISFAASADGGDTFGLVTPLIGNGASALPQIVVSGGTVYVAWLEGFPSNIAVVASTDNGVTFNTASGGFPEFAYPPGGTSFFKLAASGTNVYLVWKDDSTSSISFAGGLDFVANVGAGTSFLDITDLSISSTAFSPDLAVSGNNVYAVWQDNDALIDSSGDILFSSSPTNGALGTFTAPENLSSTPGSVSTNAKISASGINVYVAWQDNSDGDNDIYFKAIGTDGTDFASTIIPLSANTGNSVVPQITSTGSNVYVAWQDGTPSDIWFKASNNDGVGFGSGTNLSKTAKDSQSAQIDAEGSNVYVSWQDYTLDSNGDIFLKLITDSGATFRSLENLSNNSGISSSQQMAASATNLAVVWYDSTVTNDVLFRTSTPSPIDVSFDSFQYSLTDTATITVIDPLSSTTIPIEVKSTSDPTGIASLTLTETGLATGIFTGQITFGSTTLGSVLEASSGDTITATFGGQTSTASIISIEVIFTPSTLIDRGAIGHIQVTDETANLDLGVPESIIVDITSTADPIGIPLTLTETGPNTGVFGSPTSNNLIFMDADYLLPTTGTVTITHKHTAANANSLVAETILETIRSTSDPAGVDITLTETDLDTGIFTGTFTLADTSVLGSAINVTAGDIVSVIHSTVTTNGLVVSDTNPNPSNGAILVMADPVDDTVTASYRGVHGNATVSTLIEPGGGGGGISRAGLVVQAVGAIALFGGGGGGTSGPPSFDAKSFTLSETLGGALSDGSSILAESQSIISMEFKMPGGFNNLDHIGLYANIGPGQDKFDSDTYVYYDRFKTPQVTIHDPNKFFKIVTADVTEPKLGTISISYLFDFAKSLDNGNVVFESWNFKKDSALKEIPDLFKVENPKPETISETETITPTQRLTVPDWVKSNVAWWGKGAIDDTEFTNGIGYLIQNKIIDIPELLQANVSPEINSDTGLIEPTEEFTPIVPDWIKNNAVWWSEGQLTDDDFLFGIKYLLEKGIIQVKV
jgi:hypothetical protein